MLGANPAERDLGAVVKSRLAMITDPAMKNIVCSGVALISVQYGILVFTVLYLHETLEIGIGMAATLLFVAQGSGVAGRILLAAWSDRCRAGRYFPVMVCLGAVILGLLALVLLPLQSPLGMGLVVAWLGFFGFGWYGPGWPMWRIPRRSARPASPSAWRWPSTSWRSFSRRRRWGCSRTSATASSPAGWRSA